MNLVQNGEGHHNYHHAMPQDWRHGHRWYEWDPTKWCIAIWWYLGLAYDLKQPKDNQITQARAQVKEEEAIQLATQATWGPKDQGNVINKIELNSIVKSNIVV